MKIERVYLVIGADRRVRVVRRAPELRIDEVAVAVNLRFPAADWVRVVQTVDVDLPGLIGTVDAEPAAVAR